MHKKLGRQRYIFLIFLSISLSNLSGQSIGNRILKAPVQPRTGAFAINAQVVDQQGYVWIGTNAGLLRFDGKKQTLFETVRDSAYALSDNMIFRLDTLPNGQIFIQTRKGLVRFESASKRFLPINLEGIDFHSEVINYCFAPFGGKYRLVSSSRGWDLLDASSRKPEMSLLLGALENEKHHFALQNPDGSFLLLSDQRILTWKPGTEKPQLLSESPIPKLFEHGDSPKESLFLSGQNQWVLATRLGKIHVYDDNWKYLSVSKQYASIDFGTIQSLMAGPDQHLWIAALSGLYHAKLPLSSPPVHLRKDLRVYSMRRDQEGGIWLGTAEGYLTVPPLAFQFHFIPLIDPETQKSFSPWGISIDSDSNLWMGTYGGVLRLPVKGFPAFGNLHFYPKPGAPTNLTHVLPFAEKHIVAAPTGIYNFSPKEGKFQKLKLMESSDPEPFKVNPFYVMPLSDSLIACAAVRSVFAFDPRTGEVYPNYFPHSDSTGAVLYKDKKGRTWSAGGKISVYPPDPVLQQLLDSLWASLGAENTGMVFSIWNLNDHFLLIASTEGLFCLDLHAKTISFRDRSLGLLSTRIMGILGAREEVWMAADGGISSFDPEKDEIRNFTLEQGVPASDFSQLSFFKFPSGEMLFGAPDGLVWFHPDSIRISENPISVRLQEIRINHKSILGHPEKGVSHDLSGLKKIDLYPGEGSVSIGYAALNFRQPEATEYALKLEGLSNDWEFRESGERMAYYSNLPSGKYVFKIKARIRDKSWGKVRELKLIIHPSLMERIWFRLLMLIIIFSAFALAVYGFFRRKLKLEQRKMAEQQRIFAERERISRDLHDHVGSNLTALTMGIQGLRAQNKAEKDTLSGIEELARNTINRLRDSIWVLDAGEISLQDFRKKVHRFLLDFVQASGQDLEWEITCNAPDHQLETELALGLFRMVQEGIHNSIKHGLPDNISISLDWNKEQGLKVVLKDDGKGFNPSQREKEGHFGLKNLLSRTRSLKGNLEISSVSGQGTQLCWTFPVH